MLNRFVLSRTHERAAHSVQLITGEFLYQRSSVDGLGIPDLDAQLKRQRLALLLQFMHGATRASEKNWTTASTELLTSVLPSYGHRRALEFLSICPHRHGKLQGWQRISTWWRVTWTWWYKLRWELTWRDLSPADRIPYGIDQTIWYHADSELHYEFVKRPSTPTAVRRCLGMVPEPQRSFCLHISRVFGLRSLGDFRTVGEAWPTRDDFVRRHIDFTYWSVIPGVQMFWLRSSHREAPQIVDRLSALSLVRESSGNRQLRLLPRLGCTSGARSFMIPVIPRSALLHVVLTPKPPKKTTPDDYIYVSCRRRVDHRVCKLLQASADNIATGVRRFAILSSVPAVARTLTFLILEPSQSGIRLCVRGGCDAIETEQHLFFDCVLASQVWRHVTALLLPCFFVRPSWLDIALASKIRVQDDWKNDAGVVRDVWYALRL